MPAIILPPTSALGAAVITLGSLLLFRFIVYPLYISRLSKIPGPKLAALTPLEIERRYLDETAVQFIKSLHDKYGPIVRVGPNEVVVNDPKQLGPIYGVRSTYPKPNTATLFENYGYPNTFSSISREDHKQRRKQVSKVYTMNALLNNASLMGFLAQTLEKCSGRIRSNDVKPTDVYALSGFFALDNVSFFVYGRSYNSLEGENLQASEDIRSQAIASVPLVRFKSLISSALAVWPSVLLPKFMWEAIVGGASLADTNEKYIARVNAADTPVPTDTALGYMQSQAEYGKSLTAGHVKSECLDHILAGADTTAAAITWAFHTLADPKYSHHQQALRREILQLGSPLDLKAVCNLPVLDSFVLEVLRVNGPAPGSLQQRMTPAHEQTHLTIKDKTWILPPNTMVGVQAYSLHRNESVFGPDSEEFRPARWQTSDKERVQAMKEAWIPFGSGARICIGMNLALIEIKVMIASMLSQFHITFDPESDPKDMEPLFGAVLRPRAERCLLKFSELSDEDQ